MTEFMRPQVTVVEVDDRVARYIVEPLERGFGYTLGNYMRRVLLSSLQGAAATSIRIEGVQHEFTPIKGVREDVTDVVLNVKSLVFRDAGVGSGEAVATLSASGPGAVTGADLKVPTEFELVNPDQLIATLNKGAKLEMAIRIDVGRGYVSADRNKRAEDPIGVITVDSLFSPIARCTYVVEDTRVGQRTDYDKLILDIWTDGRIEPPDALLQASAILRHHLDVFVDYDDSLVDFEEAPEAVSEENAELKKLLNMSVNEIELSVRAANCLKQRQYYLCWSVGYES